MIGRLLPRVTTYTIWQLRHEYLRTPEAGPTHVRSITVQDFDAIEQARAGYCVQAQRYLDEGHQGVLIREADEVAAMGWYVVNNLGNKTRTVKGYHPLRPGHALLHADWVSLSRRGKGLGQATLNARIKKLRAEYPSLTIEAAILASNQPSIHIYRKMGFVESGQLKVVSWWRWSSGRYL